MPSGRCLCGAVQYAIAGSFLYAGYCHCSRCRMGSGSAFSAVAGAHLEALRITEGQASISTFAKSEDSILSFCKVCGSNLFAVRPSTGMVHVRMGTLAGDPGVRPMAHVFVGSKAPWHEITDDLPQFQENAPPPPTAT